MATTVTRRPGTVPTSWSGLPWGWKAKQVAAAANAHHVPVLLLLGVWAKETAAGAFVRTSSAGAKGEFQFIPSTAARWRYPMTNTPTPMQFVQQANAAAGYIAQLMRQHGGDKNAAVRAYSGGGYSADDAIREAAKYPEKFAPALGKRVPSVQSEAPFPDSVEAAAGSAVDATVSTAKFLSHLSEALFSPEWWLRVGLIVLGILALIAGVGALSRQYVTSAAKSIITGRR